MLNGNEQAEALKTPCNRLSVGILDSYLRGSTDFGTTFGARPELAFHVSQAMAGSRAAFNRYPDLLEQTGGLEGVITSSNTGMVTTNLKLFVGDQDGKITSGTGVNNRMLESMFEAVRTGIGSSMENYQFVGGHTRLPDQYYGAPPSETTLVVREKKDGSWTGPIYCMEASDNQGQDIVSSMQAVFDFFAFQIRNKNLDEVLRGLPSQT